MGNYHSGLIEETPRNAWLKLTKKYPILPPLSQDHYRHIFGILLERHIGDPGIRVFGLHYQSEQLQLLRRTVGQKNVSLRVNRYDLGEISVCTDEGWMSVQYVHAGVNMKGVCLWEWVAAAEHLKKQNVKTSNLSAPVVARALDAVRNAATMAAKRAELGDLVMSKEKAEKFDKDLFRAFAFAGEYKLATEDYLGECEPLPTEAESDAHKSAPSASQYGHDLTGWSIDD